ncbi:tetratricopeptide repeat protein [Kitasatospora sp. NPDC051853]|uniref:tetratricopeptide repeat protein n=1 Tax=Kitasatospora sp. NPDC051853 TaxID=3364058 RepID=UPI0037BA9965
MEQERLAVVTGPGGHGSGYAVGGRLVLTSAHVTGPVGTEVTVFHPVGTGTARARVLWAGTPKGRDDAALVLVDASPHWQPPTAPVLWGRLGTTIPGTPCETWGTPDEAQSAGPAVEASHLAGEMNPGSGFAGNQYVMDLRTPVSAWAGPGPSPWAGLSGAAVYCDRHLVGVVAADRAHSGHGRLDVVPSYVLHHAAAFRAVLAAHGAGPRAELAEVEFQDIADRTHHPSRQPDPATPTALLEAGRQTVPFRGRRRLLAELEAWCVPRGFGAWLLHGPAGQGKTRLAHQLAHLLGSRGWSTLWPRTGARPDQLLRLGRATRPLLVVLDYAETRPEELAALVEAATEHPGRSPFKLLLLARTDGDWWDQARTATRQAGARLGTARTHRLGPLEDDAGRRAAHYRRAARALATALPLVPGLADHDWTAAAATLTPPRDLGQDAYGNALTLHMTALADLLDTKSRITPTGLSRKGLDARDVEDRLLDHEDRYWREAAAARGLRPALSTNALRTALAAAHLTGATDRTQADLLWRRLPVLADQPRDRRDQVTSWLAALYPPTTPPGGPPWGTLQPDRLAERHVGRTLEADPHLADHLLEGADPGQAAQLLTVYGRAAAQPTLRHLEPRLTDLCIRQHRVLAPHIVTAATRTDRPAPLITALDTVLADPTTSLEDLDALHGRFPTDSNRLADTALRLAQAIVDRRMALLKAHPDTAHLADLTGPASNLALRLHHAGHRKTALKLIKTVVAIHRSFASDDPDTSLYSYAVALTTLANQLGEAGHRKKSLAAAREAADHFRTLASADPDAYRTDLAMALNNLAVRLQDTGRLRKSLPVIREAVDHYRTLAGTDPDAHLDGLATALNNLANQLSETGSEKEGLAVLEESVAHYHTLAESNPDAHLAGYARGLFNLALRLGQTGRRKQALAVGREAVALHRSLADINPDAHLRYLADALFNLAVDLGTAGRHQESLPLFEEAVTIRLVLARNDPDTHLHALADALNNLAIDLGETGRRKRALRTIAQAVAIYRTLARAQPERYAADLRHSLRVADRLRGPDR